MPEPCPICGNQSNAGSPTFRGRKEVTCETCGQFQLSHSGEAALKGLSPQDRRAKLEEARRRAGPGEIPVSWAGHTSVIRVAVADYMKRKRAL